MSKKEIEITSFDDEDDDEVNYDDEEISKNFALDLESQESFIVQRMTENESDYFGVQETNHSDNSEDENDETNEEDQMYCFNCFQRITDPDFDEDEIEDELERALIYKSAFLYLLFKNEQQQIQIEQLEEEKEINDEAIEKYENLLEKKQKEIEFWQDQTNSAILESDDLIEKMQNQLEQQNILYRMSTERVESLNEELVKSKREYEEMYNKYSDYIIGEKFLNGTANIAAALNIIVEGGKLQRIEIKETKDTLNDETQRANLKYIEEVEQKTKEIEIIQQQVKQLQEENYKLHKDLDHQKSACKSLEKQKEEIKTENENIKKEFEKMKNDSLKNKNDQRASMKMNTMLSIFSPKFAAMTEKLTKEKAKQNPFESINQSVAFNLMKQQTKENKNETKPLQKSKEKHSSKSNDLEKQKVMNGLFTFDLTQATSNVNKPIVSPILKQSGPKSPMDAKPSLTLKSQRKASNSSNLIQVLNPLTSQIDEGQLDNIEKYKSALLKDNGMDQIVSTKKYIEIREIPIHDLKEMKEEIIFVSEIPNSFILTHSHQTSKNTLWSFDEKTETLKTFDNEIMLSNIISASGYVIYEKLGRVHFVSHKEHHIVDYDKFKSFIYSDDGVYIINQKNQLSKINGKTIEKPVVLKSEYGLMPWISNNTIYSLMNKHVCYSSIAQNSNSIKQLFPEEVDQFIVHQKRIYAFSGNKESPKLYIYTKNLKNPMTTTPLHFTPITMKSYGNVLFVVGNEMYQAYTMQGGITTSITFKLPQKIEDLVDIRLNKILHKERFFNMYIVTSFKLLKINDVKLDSHVFKKDLSSDDISKSVCDVCGVKGNIEYICRKCNKSYHKNCYHYHHHRPIVCGKFEKSHK